LFLPPVPPPPPFVPPFVPDHKPPLAPSFLLFFFCFFPSFLGSGPGQPSLFPSVTSGGNTFELARWSFFFQWWLTAVYPLFRIPFFKVDLFFFFFFSVSVFPCAACDCTPPFFRRLPLRPPRGFQPFHVKICFGLSEFSSRLFLIFISRGLRQRSARG